MKEIIHFHPNYFYAKKFVKPLMHAEEKVGYFSKIVTETSNSSTDHFLMFSITFNPVFLIFRFLKLLFFLFKNKPDMIFAHNSTSSLLPMLVSRLLHVKKIIYFNHGLPYLGYVGPLRFFLKFLETVNCKLAHNIITVSDDLKQKFSNLTKKKVSIIHNGSACGLLINSKKFNTSSLDKLKKRINFNSNDKIILFVGRPNKRKGFYDILEIWCRFFKNKSNFKLILLGINQNDILKTKKRIANNIFPMGLIAQPDSYYNLADYLFMTSHHEGLSYSILEAFLHRTIVISNKIDGVTELVKNNYNGYLIKKNNKDQYLKKMQYCENNKKIKKQMLDRSQKITLKYDRSIFLQSYIELIKELDDF